MSLVLRNIRKLFNIFFNYQNNHENQEHYVIDRMWPTCPASVGFVNITTFWTLSCHIILQKSLIMCSVGPDNIAVRSHLRRQSAFFEMHEIHHCVPRHFDRRLISFNAGKRHWPILNVHVLFKLYTMYLLR